MHYADFLAQKRRAIEAVGFDVPIDRLNPMLFDWQKDIVRWALRRGRAALFEDCGLGKTPQQLEWARHVSEHTGGNVLILAPLAVSLQTQREGAKFGIAVNICHSQSDVRPGVNITNYEKLHKFNPDGFAGIVLDESSILKAFEGKVRKMITDFAASIKYRLACTATPAPNDLIELTNHAEFLDVMSGKEIIALFFKQDGNTTHAWRLKGHAEEAFWKWMAEWSVAIRKPSDLGYDDGPFTLPALNVHQLTTESKPADGALFVDEARTLDERRAARRDSLADRVKVVADMVNASHEPWIVWCNLNAESEALVEAIPNSVEVTGSDSEDHKERSMLDFSAGKIRVLVTKPLIAGWGMNWQHCAREAFVGLSDSYEQYYQAMRRCWRFGQKRSVDCYVVVSEAEGSVVDNIARKERQASEMFDGIVKHMAIYSITAKQEKNEMTYKTADAEGHGWKMMLGDSCERIREIPDNSIGLSVFSPPFPGMYAYTNSARDVGNVKDFSQLIEHFQFLMGEMKRVTMPGRNCCIHLTQEPVFKCHDGYIGMRDFRGDVIRSMERAGWIYFGEVTIDKNPQLKASRTKENTLLFKTLSKDSSQVRPALADYILIFKKDGDNPVPIMAGKHKRWNPKDGWITEEEWCEWACPVWYRALPNDGRFGNYPGRHMGTDGIRETDVLSPRQAKDEKDEKHLCPLQLGVIERCVKLWSAPGDTIYSPFAGIGSEGYQSLVLNRKFVGCELKESYWRVACENLRAAEARAAEDHAGLFATSESAND